MCFVPQAPNFTFNLSRPWDLTKPFSPGATAFRNPQGEWSFAPSSASSQRAPMAWWTSPFTPKASPTHQASSPCHYQSSWTSSLLIQCHLQASQCSSLSPMSWTLQPPSSQTAYTLSIIRIFDNQSSVGWFQQSKKEKSHRGSVGLCNSQRTLMYQVLPL